MGFSRRQVVTRVIAVSAFILGIGVWGGSGPLGCGVDPAHQPPTLPLQMTEVGLAKFHNGLANGVDVYGNTLVVAQGVDEQVADAIQPELPSAVLVLDATTFATVGHLDLPGDPIDLVVSGDLAYIAAGDAGLLVVDLQQIDEPRLVTTIASEGYMRVVGISGDLLVAGEGAGILEDDRSDVPHVSVFDLSADPRKPVPLGRLETEGPVSDIVLVDNWLYTAEWELGVGAYDIQAFADGGEMATRRYATPEGKVDGIAVSDGYLYAALIGGAYVNQSGEIRVFDIASTKEVASVGIDMWVRSVVPRDGYVLFAGVDQGGSRIGVAAPGWDIEPEMLMDFHDGFEFTVQLVEIGDVVYGTVVQPTGHLDFSGGCAVNVEQLDTTVRGWRVD